MECPVCTTELQMTDRQGVDIDYCPRCRGIWLDRGELEKLVHLASAQEFHTPDPTRRHSSGEHTAVDDDDYEDRSHGTRYQDPSRHSPPKKESWFSRFFDFD